VSAAALATQQAGGNLAAADTLQWPLRVSNALVAYVRYLADILAPRHLAVLYPYPDQMPLWKSVAAAAILGAGTAAAILGFRRRPYVAVGWFWFLGTLVPVIGLVQIGVQSHADRYLYVPAIGILLVLVWGFNDLSRRLRSRPLLPLAAAAVYTAVLAGAGWSQVRWWRNSETLYRHTLAVTGDNPVIQYNLGTFLLDSGKPRAARPHLAAAVRTNPDALTHNNMGLALLELGDPLAALDHFNAALEFDPAAGEVHNNRGNAMAHLGRLDAAAASYREGLVTAPGDADLHANLGLVLIRQGRIDVGIRHLNLALRQDPGHRRAQRNRERILAVRDRIDAAAGALGQALAGSGRRDPAALQPPLRVLEAEACRLETLLSRQPGFRPGALDLRRYRPVAGALEALAAAGGPGALGPCGGD
jgi:tetratricopeptide (TPR) repeat protein